MKKAAKIIFKLLIAFVGFFLLGFAILYFKYNEDLPNGNKGIQADALAHGIFSALNNKAYLKTDFISWKFGNKNYIWHKSAKKVTIKWSDNEVILNQDTISKSKIIAPKSVSEKEKKELIASAEASFNNDSFWLVAPFKLFDPGVERRYIPATETENASLLVTYTNGGTTPGDSYQWFVNKNMIPEKFKMWVSIIPIDGLPASWSNWTITESGAIISANKKLLDIIPLPVSELKTWNVTK